MYFPHENFAGKARIRQVRSSPAELFTEATLHSTVLVALIVVLRLAPLLLIGVFQYTFPAYFFKLVVYDTWIITIGTTDFLYFTTAAREMNETETGVSR